MKKGLSFILVLLVITIDQFSKCWVMAHLVPYESIAVFPMLSWTLVFNSGSAFSFLADAGTWHLWFFMGLSTLISVGLMLWILKLNINTKSGLTQMLALSLILGGAMGNLIDRLHIGYVVDFIDFYYKAYHWPVFNLADTAICLGGIWLAIIWFKK